MPNPDRTLSKSRADCIDPDHRPYDLSSGHPSAARSGRSEGFLTGASVRSLFPTASAFDFGQSQGACFICGPLREPGPDRHHSNGVATKTFQVEHVSLDGRKLRLRRQIRRCLNDRRTLISVTMSSDVL